MIRIGVDLGGTKVTGTFVVRYSSEHLHFCIRQLVQLLHARTLDRGPDNVQMSVDRNEGKQDCSLEHAIPFWRPIQAHSESSGQINAH